MQDSKATEQGIIENKKEKQDIKATPPGQKTQQEKAIGPAFKPMMLFQNITASFLNYQLVEPVITSLKLF